MDILSSNYVKRKNYLSQIYVNSSFIKISDFNNDFYGF